MKYIYYIIAIVIVFSALVGYGMLNSNVKISKPALVINDRIISEDEYQYLLKSLPENLTEDQYVESIIMNELFIQEAISQKINRDENFRKSVENYYEQSLVKLLLDRKFNSFDVQVTDREIEKYTRLLKSRITLVKSVYPGVVDDAPPSVDRMVMDFIDMSDSLKFIVFKLEPGESTETITEKTGKEFRKGAVSYKLETVEENPDMPDPETDTAWITQFLIEQKKEALLDDWIIDLRKKADIWRK